MKKIIITISRGWIARNLLQSDFFRILREEYAIVILTPAYKDKRFLSEFSHPNVVFLPLEEKPWSFFDEFIYRFHKMLSWNKSTDIQLRYGIISLNDQKLWWGWYILAKSIFYPLSKVRILRDILRWIDHIFLQKKEVAEFMALIEKEQPSLVICTNTTADTEIALIKASKNKGVEVWAMPKSWDNLAFGSFRAKANKLVVWNEYMKDRAVVFQNYKEKEVEMLGTIQYDFLVDKSRKVTYEKFCEEMGLDPNKKTIFFGSEGKLFVHDSEIASIIYELIEKNELAEPCQLLIRPHYGYKHDERKFSHLLRKPGVIIDLYNVPSQEFKDAWDYSDAFTNRFINSIFHSSVIINMCSTLAIDGAALDRPVINIMFDGYKILPKSKSLTRWYENDYYQEVLKIKATQIVHNKQELKEKINAYLRNPLLDSAERKVLRQQFCTYLDGSSGKRFAKLVQSYLNSK